AEILLGMVEPIKERLARWRRTDHMQFHRQRDDGIKSGGRQRPNRPASRWTFTDLNSLHASVRRRSAPLLRRGDAIEQILAKALLRLVEHRRQARAKFLLIGRIEVDTLCLQ